MDVEQSFLHLGRLDGRLAHSPAAGLWHLQARLDGAARTAQNAGLPVTAEELETWLSGRTPPPRAGEGLNDPMSVAAIATLFLKTLPSDSAHPAARLFAFADRPDALSSEDLEALTPLWQAALRYALEPALDPSLASVAERMTRTARNLRRTPMRGSINLTTPDGRHVTIPLPEPRAWLLGMLVPKLLQRAGLTIAPLPMIVPSLRFLDGATADYVALLRSCIEKHAIAALDALLILEWKVQQAAAVYQRTKRSRLQIAAEIALVFPSVTTKRLAAIMGITPAGAHHLQRQLARSVSGTAFREASGSWTECGR